MGYHGYNLVLLLIRRKSCGEMGRCGYRDDGLSCRVNVRRQSVPAGEDILPCRDKTRTGIPLVRQSSEGTQAVSLLSAPGRWIAIHAYLQGFQSRRCRGSARECSWGYPRLPFRSVDPYIPRQFAFLEAKFSAGRQIRIYVTNGLQSTGAYELNA